MGVAVHRAELTQGGHGSRTESRDRTLLVPRSGGCRVGDWPASHPGVTVLWARKRSPWDTCFLLTSGSYITMLHGFPRMWPEGV